MKITCVRSILAATALAAITPAKSEDAPKFDQNARDFVLLADHTENLENYSEVALFKTAHDMLVSGKGYGVSPMTRAATGSEDSLRVFLANATQILKDANEQLAKAYLKTKTISGGDYASGLAQNLGWSAAISLMEDGLDKLDKDASDGHPLNIEVMGMVSDQMDAAFKNMLPGLILYAPGLSDKDLANMQSLRAYLADVLPDGVDKPANGENAMINLAASVRFHGDEAARANAVICANGGKKNGQCPEVFTSNACGPSMIIASRVPVACHR